MHSDLRTKDPKFPASFILTTVPTFIPPRKYIGILDLPLTSIKFSFRILMSVLHRSQRSLWIPADVKAWSAYDDRGLFVSSLATWRRNVHAFWAHSSQRSWDRWLYMLVSRYMWFNDVVQVYPNAPV